MSGDEMEVERVEEMIERGEEKEEMIERGEEKEEMIERGEEKEEVIERGEEKEEVIERGEEKEEVIERGEEKEEEKLRHVDLIGVLGKRRVFSFLDRSGKPDENIAEFQTVAGMAFSAKSALPFLDLLQVPRAVVYQHLFDAAKVRLEKKMLLLSEHKLIEMLSATIRYLGVSELKTIPISILKRLSHNIPMKYLHFIAKNCKQSFILDDLSAEVRQLVWHVDSSTFICVAEQCSDKWLSSYSQNSSGGGLGIEKRVFDDSVLQICKYIGNSQLLFSKFAAVCVKHSIEDKRPQSEIAASLSNGEGGKCTPSGSDSRWCTLLRHVLTNLPRDKIKTLGKLRDMAWLLDNFLRESNLNPTNKQVVYKDRKQLQGRLKVNSTVIGNIFSHVADIKRVFVAIHERSVAIKLSQNQPSLSREKSHSSNSQGRSKSASNASGRDRRNKSRVLTFSDKLLGCWTRISKMDRRKIFAQPVTEAIAPGYFSVVKHPMDLSMIFKRLPSQKHENMDESIVSYSSVDEFEEDLKLMFDNCFLYNAPDDPILLEAKKLWQSWLKNKPVVFGSEAGSRNLSLNTTSASRSVSAPPPPRIVVKSSLLLGNDSASVASKNEDLDIKPSILDNNTLLQEKSTEKQSEEKANDEKPSIKKNININEKPREEKQIDEKQSDEKQSDEKQNDDKQLDEKQKKYSVIPVPKQHESNSNPTLKMSIKLKKTIVEKSRLTKKKAEKTPNSFPLRVILKKALEYIWKVESDVYVNGSAVGIFSNPVTETEAPNYLSIIKYPMDLSTLRKRVVSDAYKSVDEFEEDLKLIFDNCREYNQDPGNIFCKVGDNLWKFWKTNRITIEENPSVSFEDLVQPRVIAESTEKKKSEKVSKTSHKNSKISKAKSTSKKHKTDQPLSLPVPPVNKKGSPSGLIGRKRDAGDGLTFPSSSNPESFLEEKNLPQSKKVSTQSLSVESKNEKSMMTPTDDSHLYKVIRKSLDVIWKVESDKAVNGVLAGVFSTPVTEEVAPGYFSYVKHPMDLSTMKIKISSHSYKCIDDFENDLIQIVENCKAYNDPKSQICAVGSNLLQFWQANRQAIEANPDISFESLKQPRKVDADEDSFELERPWPELTPIDKKIDIKESYMLHEALERAVEFLSTEDDGDIFATDVNIPGYEDIVKKPRSLNFINSRIVKYKSVESFESDVRLMFKNCIKFNEPNKDYYFSDIAVKLWNSWLKNREHILLDSEASSTTTAKVKKFSPKNDSSSTPQVKKRERDKEKIGKKPKKMSTVSMDDEEEFQIGGDNSKDEDYSFLDDDDEDNERSSPNKRARLSGKVGSSNKDLFDEESSDEDYHDLPKQSNSKKIRTTSSGAAKKVKKATSSTERKAPVATNKKKTSSQTMPMVPLHRLSSTKVKTVTSSPSSKIAPAATSSNPVPSSSPLATAPVGTVMSSAEKLHFSRNMLRWSVSLLRDNQLQLMFKEHLCDLLLSLERNSAGPTTQTFKSLGGILPFDEPTVENCLWLCQAGIDSSDGIYQLKADAYLLREALPFIMLHRLTRSVSDEVPDKEECESILISNLDMKAVSFDASKALQLLTDIFQTLMSRRHIDGVKKNAYGS